MRNLFREGLYMIITSRPIKLQELHDLIEFDRLYLVEKMENLGIAKSKCPPILEYTDLMTAHHRKDILLWLLVDKNLAGYIWRIKKSTHLFNAGAAIKPEFYGSSLSHYFLNLTDEIAKEVGLPIIRTTVIPENGRAVSAYMKHGYSIIDCLSAYAGPQYPDTFRCLMEKNLIETTVAKTSIDSCEVFCTDEKNLKMMTDSGYVGTGFIKESEIDFAKNKIIFQRFC